MKPLFIPYFINYLRDQSLNLLAESKSANTTPAKTPLSSKFKRQLSKDDCKLRRGQQQKTANRINLFPVSNGFETKLEQPLGGSNADYSSSNGPRRRTRGNDVRFSSPKQLKSLDSPRSRYLFPDK